ncbi:MAG: restriction endonuclease subunit S, partial [Anaerolineales bacterium]|nr:restriction endonuclease subunit S [Anaerolineales bacterium]
MRITHQECLPEYLAIYLNSSIGKALSNRGVTGGTRIALDYEVIKKIQIPLPPQKVQEKIIKELHSLQSQARQLRQEAESQWQTAKEKFEKALLG